MLGSRRRDPLRSVALPRKLSEAPVPARQGECGTNGVASLADILQIEARDLASRELADNTYSMLRAGAAIQPRSSALSFFATAADFEQLHTLSYREFLAQITRAANMFRSLGIGRH